MKQVLRKHILNLQSRQGWKKSPYFICEGLRCCREAFQRRPEWIEAIVYEESFQPEDLDASSPYGETVGSSVFRELANTENPQGVMLLMRRPDLTVFPGDPGNTILVLDRLSDPGNVGTILRTAWAMGFATVTWTIGTCHPLGAKPIRAGMGAQFSLNLPCVPSVDALKEHFPKRTIWLTSPRAKVSCDSADFISANSFIVLGNEAGGVQDLPDAQYVKISMPGIRSNRSTATRLTCLSGTRWTNSPG